MASLSTRSAATESTEIGTKAKTSVKRKHKQPVKIPQKKTSTQIRLERFSSVLLRAVQANFAQSAFTRDDVLKLVSAMRLGRTETWANVGGVNDTATGTRLNKVSEAIGHLIQNDQLVRLDWVRLCLPKLQRRLASETSNAVAYLPTIRQIVQEFEPGGIIDVMLVVERWGSDQHLPENMKRMTVRSVFTLLKHENVLYENNLGQYVVK